jgi:hypothetical protein
MAFGLAVPASATLLNRGGGLIYDTDLNITWLQDANYARTTGYDADGLMTWSQAMTWASGLVYQGYDDWRLPVSDICWGACTGSEMGHLYYIEGTGPFINVQPYLYWSQTTYQANPWSPVGVLVFDFSAAGQASYLPESDLYAWAVRSGDSTPASTPIPEPSTMLLLGSALAGFAAWSARRHTTGVGGTLSAPVVFLKPELRSDPPVQIERV